MYIQYMYLHCTSLDLCACMSMQHSPDSYSGSPEPDADSTLNSGPESTSDPGDPDLTSDLDDPRSAVLEAALLHVPALGWTPAALEEGAKSVGVPESAEDMFPRSSLKETLV